MNREETKKPKLEEEEFDLPVLGKTKSKSAPTSPRQGACCESHELRYESAMETMERIRRESAARLKR